MFARPFAKLPRLRALLRHGVALEQLRGAAPDLVRGHGRDVRAGGLGDSDGSVETREVVERCDDAGADEALALGLADLSAAGAGAASLDGIHHLVEVVVLLDDGDGRRGRSARSARGAGLFLVAVAARRCDAGGGRGGGGARSLARLGCGVRLGVIYFRGERVALVGQTLDSALADRDLQRGVDGRVAVLLPLADLIEGVAHRAELPREALGLLAKTRQLLSDGAIAAAAAARRARIARPRVAVAARVVGHVASAPAIAAAPGVPRGSLPRRRRHRGIADDVTRDVTLPSSGDAEPPEELVVTLHRPTLGTSDPRGPDNLT